MKIKNVNGVILAIMGLFVILLLQGLGEGRELAPTFDDQIDDFRLTIIDHSNSAIVGGTYDVDLKVSNSKSTAGKMYVQCSILDLNEQAWLTRTGFQTIEDNCKPNEPFTQTGQISLAGGEQRTFTFTVQVPDTTDGENVIYCAAYEQCWAEDVDPLESDYVTKDITVREPTSDAEQAQNLETVANTCENKVDCSGWLLGGVVCENGHCVDVEDVPEDTEIDFSDNTIKQWMFEHKFLLTVFAFVALVIGMIVAYSEKKRRLI